VRSFALVGGDPFFINRGKGAKVWDADGNSYIDYVGSWGALILGHAHPNVVRAVKAALEKGSSFGAPTAGETELAKQICAAFPSIEKVRLVSSGTEAVLGALKLARAFTKKKRVLRFQGCYHGWAEYPWITVPYNDLSAAAQAVRSGSREIAAIIVEPVAGNMGVVPALPGFLEGLRKLADQFGTLLIFDEVITGFRVAYGGAQELFGIKADLTCLGKIIGGGFPVGAYGGRRELMDKVSPLGPVYQAGTLSGNPVAVAAGLETLTLLRRKGAYKRLEENTKELCLGMGMDFLRVGSMFSFIFNTNSQYRSFFWRLLKEGIYFAPSEQEANFLSLAHTEKEIEKTIKKGGRL
jgi:glutamate-1-semialdehyde 2,1-aminomutase